MNYEKIIRSNFIFLIIFVLVYMGCGSTEDNEEQPTPTRSLIAFSSSRDDNPTTSYFEDIYIMNPDGTNIARFYHQGGDSRPAWSPDGKKIAFWASLPGDYHALRMLDIDGLNITELLIAGFGRLSWSPDGKKIVFATDRQSQFDIYIINPDGSNLTQLTNDEATELDPSWSPDGKKIVFGSNRDDKDFDLYIMDTKGKIIQRIVNPGEDMSPSWSPDGKKIAFTSSLSGHPPEIYIINADGTNLVKLTNHPKSNELYSGASQLPSWSPDGKKIVFQSDMYSEGGIPGIYVMNADGTNVVKIAEPGFTPSWSPWLR